MKYLRPIEALLAIKTISREDPWVGLVCEILYTTGRRIGELLTLSMSRCEIGFSKVELIFLEEKKRGSLSRNEIEVRIPRKEWDYWASILKGEGAVEGRSYFFSRKKRGKEEYRALVARYIRVLTKLADQQEVIQFLLNQKNNRFHLWRHSYVLQLRKEFNYDIIEVHQAIGHESIETTMRHYGKWFFPPEKRFAKFWDDQSDS